LRELSFGGVLREVGGLGGGGGGFRAGIFVPEGRGGGGGGLTIVCTIAILFFWSPGGAVGCFVGREATASSY